MAGRRILLMGASSGIGKKTAIYLSELDAEIILVARREDKLQETIGELKGNCHCYYPFDLNELDDIGLLVKRIVNERGKLDGLVFCAGMTGSMPINLLKPEKLKALFNVNYFAFVECVRQVTKKGNYNPGMRIVGISSVSSLCGDKAHTAYASSKAAMDSAVRCLAQELAAKDICINTVAPAMTATEMYYEDYLKKNGEDSEANKSILKRQYLGVAKTEDVASAIAFLLSPVSRFITGICLPVDGGYTTC